MTYRSRTLSRAIEVFGSKDLAEEWLDTISAELGAAPDTFLDTREGYERVIRLLRTIDMKINAE